MKPQILNASKFVPILILSLLFLLSSLYSNRASANLVQNVHGNAFAEQIAQQVESLRPLAVNGNEIQLLINNLDALTGDTLVNALETLVPLPNGADYFASTWSMNRTIASIDRRIDEMRKNTQHRKRRDIPVYDFRYYMYGAGDCASGNCGRGYGSSGYNYSRDYYGGSNSGTYSSSPYYGGNSYGGSYYSGNYPASYSGSCTATGCHGCPVESQCTGITTGPFFMGGTQSQNELHYVPGYRAVTKGLGALIDIDVTCAEWLDGGLEAERVLFGAGAFYYKTDLHNKTTFENKSAIKSGQLFLYHTAEKCQWYWDLILAGAYNWSHERRAVGLSYTNQYSFADYNSFQGSGKFKIGYVLLSPALTPGIRVLPQASIQASYFSRGNFTELGTATLVNEVQDRSNTELQGGLGLEILFAGIYDCVIPEIHAFYYYDFKQPVFDISSRFIQGGAPFILSGVKPARTGVNAGLSLTAKGQWISMTLAYDLEARRQYWSNAASVWFRWMF